MPLSNGRPEQKLLCQRNPVLLSSSSTATHCFCRWLQVGMAADRDQYVHRVGRTARAGKQGEAVLILQDMERGFLRSLTDLPLQKLPALDAPVSCMSVLGLEELLEGADRLPFPSMCWASSL